MTVQETPIYDSGQRVGLAVAPFTKELDDFAPLKAANDERAELVAAIKERQAAQGGRTTGSTTAKEEAREVLARATETLSARAVGYALATRQLGLKQTFTLTYTDVRFGEADEDVAAVRALVAAVRALPAKVRQDYRLSAAVVDAPAEAADAFEKAEDTQTTTKAAPRLASLALPELLRQLSAALRLMQTLLKGMSTDKDVAFRWAELYAAFRQANKRQAVAPSGRRAAPAGARIVRTLPLTAHDDRAHRLANTNYGPAYTVTVENRAASALRLWMAQRDGAETTPLACPAGAVTTGTRAELGPATARYLTARFEGAAGGEATLVVRRITAD